MALKDIFCQDRAIGILQRALAAERSAHAYIFAGLEGVGKFATARQWARLLLCEHPVDTGTPAEPFVDSCGSCASCRLFDGDSHPDFIRVYKELREFTRDGKGKAAPVDLPIDVVREFFLEKAVIRPTHAPRKVFVISEAERLNASSQNALLKILEEPPAYCTIILLCTRIEKLLPTTKSRCQTVRFGPIEDNRIVAALTEIGLPCEPAQFFARLAQGSLGRACQWARLEGEGAGLFETKKKVVTALTGLQLVDALAFAERFLALAKEVGTIWAGLDKAVSKTDLARRAQKTLIQIALSAFHDAMLINVAPDHPLVHADQRSEIARLADRLGPEQAAERVDAGYEALRWIDANVNDKLIFERLLLRLVPSAIITAER